MKKNKHKQNEEPLDEQILESTDSEKTENEVSVDPDADSPDTSVSDSEDDASTDPDEDISADEDLPAASSDILPEEGSAEESADEEEDSISYEDLDPIPMELSTHDINTIVDDDDPDTPLFVETSTKRSDATVTTRGKKMNLKPRMFLIVMAVISLIILAWSVFSLGNISERLASPLTVGNQDVSNAEFSFMYHYVLLENGVDIFKEKTEEMLSSPGENGFASYRDYFLDATAKEIQTVSSTSTTDAL
ncbi:MAG: hypothetical protein IKM88_03050 [Lachnospiraceae bacterium]|nr:hypothetical protein [Lachnospiraceae bacterium]